MKKHIIVIMLALVGVATLVVVVTPVERFAGWAWAWAFGGATVQQRLDQYGPAARAVWLERMQQTKLDTYPPKHITLIGIKDQRILEVWASDTDKPKRLLHTFPILAASGSLGPKLHEGDRQVPEGLYRIESLNPNSLFHLSLRVNYPNADDRRYAEADGRTNLGGDIMIHGNSVSAGCLAMGDPAAEQLFVLAADVGLDNVEVILTPVDFRTSDLPETDHLPRWTAELYPKIRGRLDAFTTKPTE